MSALPASLQAASPLSITRVRVFVDYWNLQLTLERKFREATRNPAARFQVDWVKLGPWLARKAAEVAGVAAGAHSFEGVGIYTSYDPNTDNGTKYRKWATTWLNRQPGVTVHCRERSPKSSQRCPSCRSEILVCPHCTKPIKATIEKGVDTLIATDMIRLAWERAYDLAVIASSDSDLVPAVTFLDQKGVRIIQAGFPPIGVDLATSCWASFDVFADRKEIERLPGSS